MFLARHVHPEFGWFCPSSSLRRNVRVAFVTLVSLTIVGVVALRAGRGPGFDAPSAVGPGGAARAVTAIIETDGSAAAAQRPAAADLGKSTAGAMRRVLVPRAANEAPLIAALPLGRGTPLEPAPSAAAVALADTADTAAPEQAPVVADAPKVPAPPPRRVRNPSRVHNYDRDVMYERRWRDQRWTAWPDDRYLREPRYSRSWGPGFW